MFDVEPMSLFLGLLFSGIGFVAYRYGRRMDSVPPIFLGLALMVYPWFVSSALWILVVGSALTALLWVFRE